MARLKFTARADEDMGQFQNRLRDFLESLTSSAKAVHLTKQSVGTSSTKISHGLGYKPAGVRIGLPSVDCRVWRPTSPDENFVYLQASTACTVDIEVW